MINVLFFASLRETLGTATLSMDVPDPAMVETLIAQLRMRGDAWASALDVGKRWRVAVNQEVASLASPLKAGDEVAIFPPVTGG
jgi:molybdopterin synthase sulfur carrier subunit